MEFRCSKVLTQEESRSLINFRFSLRMYVVISRVTTERTESVYNFQRGRDNSGTVNKGFLKINPKRGKKRWERNRAEESNNWT